VTKSKPGKNERMEKYYYWQTQCSCLWFQWHLCSH